ncbi:cellulase family glycosylhydrolase [Phototrophicus methaneseepsis]|uniref:Cellulase family glycosylhydrolase n=1 Tax=Phototrophicus methaneseepsis TaxID=2710758 RepID=A0A7S8IET5_9CHLR|nr:endo-1,4-beta-xylanase [Phototrophicus methaneseepsis]QPC82153.1 cellulase family glycosylhydrolase [Phototrophicus methaneseepsis]
MTQTRRILIISLVLLVAALAIAAGVFISQRNADPFKGDAVTDAPFPSLTYALQAFLWWDEGQVGTHLDWVRLVGFNTVKQNFPWRDLEPEPGQWDFSRSDLVVERVERRDLYLVARLGQTPDWAHSSASTSDIHVDSPPDDLADWANYCGTVAAHYKGRIRAYQVWNEPNLSREWGDQPPDPAAYVEMLSVCSKAIRIADPDAIVISAGLSPTGNNDAIAMRDDLYLQALYDANFQQFVDVVGVHAPGYNEPEYGPDDAEQNGEGRWFSFRRVEDLRKIMVANDDAARQMAILEFGWTTDTTNPDYSWFSVTEEQQADYIVRAYTYALENWSPWVGLMTLIYLPDPHWTDADEESWWAIVAPDGRVREAFSAIASMPKTCGTVTLPYRRRGHPEFNGSEPPRTCP